jgi:hypothetical protein
VLGTDSVPSIVDGRLDHLERIESSAMEALAETGSIKQKVDD